MRLPRLDLRLRIAAVLSIVCISIVGTLGVTLYAAADEMEQALIEQLVTEELDSLVERTQSGERVFASGPNLQYYVLHSAADREQLPPTVRSLGPGLHEVGQGSSEKRIGIRDNGGTRYVVVYDEGAHELREAHLRQLLLFSLITAIILSIVVGYALAGVLTRQLDELAERVVLLAPDEPHPPLERADHDREVATLARALDQYHNRLLAMMQREQEFTANASHELRTPLTAITTTCELLRADAHLDEKSRKRVETVSEAAARITDHLESLLRLARAEIIPAQESVRLRQCVTDAAAPYRQAMADKKLQFDVRVAEGVVLRLDRKALQLVLA
ncbi:MAG TPA: HAMP domain-containing sensor histidine kinase, partial [Burkholderiales bacterium]|nr:HAMP domain-containing sensor histidine kinase [Burkholderiales bacterium]